MAILNKTHEIYSLGIFNVIIYCDQPRHYGYALRTGNVFDGRQHGTCWGYRTKNEVLKAARIHAAQNAFRALDVEALEDALTYVEIGEAGDIEALKEYFTWQNIYAVWHKREGLSDEAAREKANNRELPAWKHIDTRLFPDGRPIQPVSTQ